MTIARKLRGTPTDVEQLLWWKLRARQFGGWKFRRQVPVIGYVADFACLEARLIIELDGGQHAETVERDEHRTKLLEQAGFRVLRFWNVQLTEDLAGVIEHALGGHAGSQAPSQGSKTPSLGSKTPSPQPSPRGGEGEGEGKS